MDSATMVTSQFDILDLMNLAVGLGFLAAGVLSILYMFIGGISFILSGGQEDKIRQAFNTIRYAIIGLMVTLLSVGLVSFVGLIFDYELTTFISFDRIKELMLGLIDRAVSGGSSSNSLPGSGTLR